MRNRPALAATPAIRRLPAPAEPPSARPGFAALLSMLLPGLGQAYAGRWRRAAAALGLPLVAGAVLAGVTLALDPLSGAIIRRADAMVALVFGGALAYHLATVGDAFAGAAGWSGLRGRERRSYAALALAVAVLLAGYGGVYRQGAAWASLATKIFAAGDGAGARAGEGGAPEAPAAVWSGTERLNVLLLGIDSRGADSTLQNTDTMIVLSIDPLNRTAAMLSIPRDTYIDRPGVYVDKINGAYGFGGPELSQTVVESLLGIRVHAYALVDFDVFTTVVDAVGGVVVDVRRPLRDEAYPGPGFGVQRISILAGPQVMSGSGALTYARSRHESSDYDRARRQQDVLGALRASLVEGNQIFRIPAILDRAGPTLRTNFDPANVLPVARLGANIARSDIRSEVMYPCGAGTEHCELREQSGPGGFYLFPDRARIADLVAQLFYDPAVRHEAAAVEIRGAGARQTTVSAVAERLAARAYSITAVTSGAAAKTSVLLRDPAKRYTAESLAAQLGVAVTNASPADETAAGIVVLVGADYRGLAGDAGR